MMGKSSTRKLFHYSTWDTGNRISLRRNKKLIYDWQPQNKSLSYSNIYYPVVGNWQEENNFCSTKLRPSFVKSLLHKHQMGSISTVHELSSGEKSRKNLVRAKPGFKPWAAG